MPSLFTNPAATDKLSYPSHAQQHIDVNNYIKNIGVINAKDYGLSEDGTGAENKTALDDAFAAASTAQASVYIPAGSYYLTGTVTASGPACGEGPAQTIFYPTTSVPAFDLTLNYGRVGGLSIDYVNVGYAGINANAIGFRLMQLNNGKVYDALVWHGYRAVQVLSTVGNGYIWQAEFDNVVSAYNKDYAFYIDSSSDSTTVKFSNCHVYGIPGYDTMWPAGQTFKGWYAVNVTSIIFSNCSMDGGDGDVDGSVIYYDSGQSVFIDSFHLEGFTHTTGGANQSPFVLRGKSNIVNNLVLVDWEVDVGAGIDGTLIRTGTGTGGYFQLGQISEVSTTVTSGTKIYADVTGAVDGAQILSRLLDKDNFLYTSGTGKHIFAKDLFGNTENYVQLGGSYVSVTTAATTVLDVPDRSNGNDSGLFWVHGENVSSGVGFVDLIALNAARNGSTVISVISSKDNGSIAARTYSWDDVGKSIDVLLTAGSASVICGGFAVVSP